MQKTTQQRKAESVERDRRSTIGETSKAARKGVARTSDSEPRRAPAREHVVRSRARRRPRCRSTRLGARAAQVPQGLAEIARRVARSAHARDGREGRDDGLHIEEAAPAAESRGALTAVAGTALSVIPAQSRDRTRARVAQSQLHVTRRRGDRGGPSKVWREAGWMPPPKSCSWDWGWRGGARRS